MFCWILGAKRLLWLIPMSLETKSPKNLNPHNGGAYSKPTAKHVCRGATSKQTSNSNLRGFWIVGFHFLVLPNMACPHTLSRIYLRICFWGTCGVLNIMWAILPVSIVYTLTIQCTPVFELKTSVKLHEPASQFWSNPVWGITVPFIGAFTPMHPAPAIVVTPPDREPPNNVEAQKHVSYALTASSVAPAQEWACALELVEFASESLARDVLPTRRDGSLWKQSDYGLTPYRAARVKQQFGKLPGGDACKRVPGMAQATSWVSTLDDCFSSPADRCKLYWMCPPYHRLSDRVWKIRREKIRAIVVRPKWTHREWRKPHMEITLRGTIFLGRRLGPVSIRMTTSHPSLNGVGPQWRYKWTVVLRKKFDGH